MNYPIIYKSLLITLLLIMQDIGFGQRPLIFNKPLSADLQTRFIRLTSEDGLSNNRVLDILQDKNGFIWIATIDGLNKYDGSRFEVFKHKAGDSTSLSSNLVCCLLESRDGNLFVGTKKGLHLYNRFSNNFQKIVLAGGDYNAQDPYIRSVLEGPNATLWITDVDGYLLKYDRRTKRIEKTYKTREITQPYYFYHPLYYDTDSVLWLGGRGVNPTYLDEPAGALKTIEADHYDFRKKRESDVACYYEDSKGVFWVTALDGIYTMKKEDGLFKKFVGTSTWDIHEDKKGLLWFATGSGVYRFNRIDSTLTSFVNQKDNSFSLSSNSVHKVYEDKRGNMWFGTSMGVSIYAPPVLPFGKFSHLPGIENSPEGHMVTAVTEDGDSNLWIGYQKSGLDYFDRKQHTFYHYPKGFRGLSSNHISALYMEQRGRLWVGLWEGIGFNIYDPQSKEFSLYSYDPNSQRVDWYNDFIEDDLGHFYIGFWGADGLTFFDRRQMTFGANFKDRFPRIQGSRLVTRLFKDRSGCIWMGTTASGLHRYFPSLDSTASYFADEQPSRGLTDNGINDITQDADGTIWLISNTLQRYIPDKDSFASYTIEDGLQSERLVSLLSDENGNLWIGTEDDGLFRFTINGAVFKQFFEEDGLQSNSFSKARFKLKSGALFFGGQKGFNLFDPSEIRWKNDYPKVSFGRMYVFDEVRVHDLNEVQFVNLAPGENVFTIELGSYDRVVPERYVYQCKLEGYDKDWVTVDSEMRARRYAGIAPGTYTFHYRIGHRAGKWYMQSLKIMIHLQIPFYKTWWFISFSLMLLFVLGYLILQRRMHELQEKQRSLELQQKLFRLQMNPHFMFNSLLAIQNYIFMHNTQEAGDYLSDFARLFRLILDNSKAEFVPMEKEMETLELYLKLQKLRYHDKFDYTIDVDAEIEYDLIRIPPMLAQPMIENALEHGLFHKEGKGHIWVRFKLKGDTLIFEVEDDGIGLTEAKKYKPATADHQSTALNITHERIQILARKHRFFVIFEIKEIIKEDGLVKGTLVRFNMPYKPFGYEFKH